MSSRLDNTTIDSTYPPYSLNLPSLTLVKNTSRRRRAISTEDWAIMSGYYYPATSTQGEDEYTLTQSYATGNMQYQTGFQDYEYASTYLPPPEAFANSQQYQTHPHVPQYQAIQPQYFQPMMDQSWGQPLGPATFEFQGHGAQSFPGYQDAFGPPEESTVAGSSTMPTNYLSPGQASRPRASRATSFASNASSISDISRSVSPNAGEMLKWGFRNEDGSWSCAYPGCSSKSKFHRGCDLRKHYKRHTKTLFCRHESCPQAHEGGFSSKKDRARHEAKHNPNIVCEWEGCERLFSRQDNMVHRICSVLSRK